ncbi:hypothetical protein SPBR_03792 [Sporothrix brasiliensis 5110]|uniref:Uncharacterized protein n=1 Tax=Sporothrix brasiliensis 5110 TaxID=1398154 RepID=A0A0C2JCR4_9PEZI|nr:uncharacterized protein SPBR_03792 [Sporothrix brasiliensis 5110]KIH94707.1 hypothetical protein SPBR_03792 [Sporothrix brasiliensis 5110]
MQVLYATGFNAWGQLQFNTTAVPEDEPDDIWAFTRVRQDHKIVHVRPSLSYTEVTTSEGIATAGAAPVAPVDISRISDGNNLHFAEALNGCVLVYDKNEGALLQYASADDYSAAIHRRIGDDAAILTDVPCSRFAGYPGVRQVVAYDVGFAILTTDGQVWTWGDPRFPECLGRDVTESPAERPGLVTALDDLPTGPIVKLAAGGHVLAAVTQGRDLYCWGGYPGRRPVLLEGVTGEPTPIVVSATSADGYTEDVDVVDVGMGDGHMIVLATDGSVFVLGSNANGQLGIGHDSNDARRPPVLEKKIVTTWVKVRSLPPGQVTGVYAGPKSSFIVVTE